MKVITGAAKFGLGPAGKLAAIVRQSPEIGWFGSGDPFILNVFRFDPFTAACWSYSESELRRFCRESAIDAALVVGDPVLATVLQKGVGLPVVYVDSLPFLWSQRDVVPAFAEVYCAQMCLALPIACWETLRKIRNLRWVEGIVPSIPSPGGGREGIVINFGGVINGRQGCLCYLDVMVPAAVAALQDVGAGFITVTAAREAIEYIRDCQFIGDYKHIRWESPCQEEFLEWVNRSRLLVTSPGLTGLIETAPLGVPTVILPPQNLSQYFNVDTFCRCVESPCAVSWKSSSLTREFVEQVRQRGEEEAIRHIYREIGRLKGDPVWERRVEQEIRESVLRALTQPYRSSLVGLIGNRGAEEVLTCLRRI